MSNKNITWHEHQVNKDERSKIKEQKPCIIWFTGLSASGKSSIANALENELHIRKKHTYLLDGDNVRMGLNKGLGFNDEDRVENIRRIAEVSKLFVDAGIIVLTAFISPFEKERAFVRSLVNEGEFIEVFVDSSLHECELRDPKGLYKEAREGGIENFTGISSPYEAPKNAEIHIRSDELSIEEATTEIVEYLDKQGMI